VERADVHVIAENDGPIHSYIPGSHNGKHGEKFCQASNCIATAWATEMHVLARVLSSAIVNFVLPSIMYEVYRDLAGGHSTLQI